MILFNSIRHRASTFFIAENGGIAIVFVIVFPVILSVMALYFDSIQLVAKRAKLADAMNEGMLAIASRDDSDNANNLRLLNQYLQDYLPEANRFIDVSIERSQTDEATVYSGKAKAEVNTTFSALGIKAFDKEVNVSYGSDATITNVNEINGDFVFVVDMSGSMRGRKLKELKQILKETINAGKKSPNTTFGLVPFGNGVPVRLAGKNELGGEIAGCSVVFVPNDGYDIDYQYWSSIKPTNYASLQKNAHFADRYRYEFYKNFARPSGASLRDNIEHYCFTNANKGNYASGNYRYSCLSDKHNSGDVGVPQSMVFQDMKAYQNLHAKTIHPTYAAQITLAYKVVKEAQLARYRNIAHDKSINYQETINRLFIPADRPGSAVLTFYLPWTSTASRYRPFGRMCQMIKGKRSTYANAKVHTRLIELSQNLDDLDTTTDDDIPGIDEDDGEIENGDNDTDNEIGDGDIDDLEAGGPTETMSGFMRAVPVVAKGKSKNKAIIIISDGGDNSNITMRDTLMDSYGLCEKVKDPNNYKTYAPDTEKVDLYFILLGSKGAHKKHVARWGSCVGHNHVYHAPSGSELADALFEITTNGGKGSVVLQ